MSDSETPKVKISCRDLWKVFGLDPSNTINSITDDMSKAEDAFGVFTSERTGDDIGIGQGSEYEAGLLRFYKGRFFLSIMTFEETPQSKKTILSLAR